MHLLQKPSSTKPVLLLILLTAAALRLVILDSLPPGLYHDEAYNGLDALSLIQGKTFPQYYEGWELYALDAHEGKPVQDTSWPVFFEGNYGREPLHIYLMALSIKVLGIKPMAIRVVPALAGILGVWTTYLAARALQKKQSIGDSKDDNQESAPRKVALIAAFFTAILFPAILFSRFGIRGMLIVPLETLSVFFFWLGINSARESRKTGRIPVWLYFLVAGICLGLAIYSYAAARLLPVLFIVFIPYWFWKDRSAIRQHWTNMLLMASSAVLVALPIILYFVENPYFFIFRIGFVANRGQGAVEGRPLLTWILNGGRVIRGLFLQGDVNLRQNLPGRSFLDPIQGVLFFGGVTQTIRRRTQLQTVFLWIWLIVMLLPSVLSGDAPHFGRMIGATPPLAIFIAQGANWFIKQAAIRTNRKYLPRILAILAVLLIPSFILSVRDYFFRYAGLPDLAPTFQESDWKLGKFAYDQGVEKTLYLVPNQEEMATIYYALGDPEAINSFNGESGLIPAGIPGKESVYLIRTDNFSASTEVLKTVSDYFPEGRAGSIQDGFIPFAVGSEVERIRIPTSDEAIAGESKNVFFEDKIKLSGWSIKNEGGQLLVTMIHQAMRDMDLDYTVFIHIANDDGEIVSQRDRQPAGYPTSDWREGEITVEQYWVPLPTEGDPELYTVQTGFYYLPTLARLGKPVVLTELFLP